MLRAGHTELHNMLKTVERGLEHKSKYLLVVDVYKDKYKGKFSWVVFKVGKPRKGFTCFKCGEKGIGQVLVQMVTPKGQGECC